jgi:hypothetical protein
MTAREMRRSGKIYYTSLLKEVGGIEALRKHGPVTPLSECRLPSSYRFVTLFQNKSIT